MLIKRLFLRNYRVYEDPLELELPSGLVGVYGPNGAGKSYLIESIRWTLYGKSRTTNDDVRTDGVGGECMTEVTFEHEGHLYEVRRVVTAGGSVKASAVADGRQVAEGVQDTGRYVRSILGMDDAAFRASVFAEQKQVAAFSDQTPAKRKELVLRLLGITPLDRARDDARRDARQAREDYERLRTTLPDLDQRRSTLEDSAAASDAAEQAAAAYERDEEAALGRRTGAEAAAARLGDLEIAYTQLVEQERAAGADMTEARARVARLTEELAGLEAAAAELATHTLHAGSLVAAEARLGVLEAVARAEAELSVAELPPEPPPVDEAAEECARASAVVARERLAELTGARDSAKAGVERALQAYHRSSELSADEPCPVCGQELGDAFENVQSHRRQEHAEARSRLEDLEASVKAAAADAERAVAEARLASEALARARRERVAYDQAAERHAAAVATWKAALDRLGEELPVGAPPERVEEARAEVQRCRHAAAMCERLTGRLERRPAATRELASERARADEADNIRAVLRDKIATLGFDPDAGAAARAEMTAARAAHSEVAGLARKARVEAAACEERHRASQTALEEALRLHAAIEKTASQARQFSRLADLLGGFRESVVSAVGPRLSVQAADLFAELTDNEYDRLEVDPETYDIQIRDAGRLHGMDRFSGSETDLANLALRVAIGEQVRFQSGGQVGLLVLDEVFGPLDSDRKERMLLALERLRAHFRQVLVVTHDAGIKEQLPNAIEVMKLGGRRASARLL